jgi:hypothetical protein
MNMTFRREANAHSLSHAQTNIATFAEAAASYIEHGGHGPGHKVRHGCRRMAQRRRLSRYLCEPRNAGRIVADRHNLYQFDNDL